MLIWMIKADPWLVKYPTYHPWVLTTQLKLFVLEDLVYVHRVLSEEENLNFTICSVNLTLFSWLVGSLASCLTKLNRLAGSLASRLTTLSRLAGLLGLFLSRFASSWLMAEEILLASLASRLMSLGFGF